MPDVESNNLPDHATARTKWASMGAAGVPGRKIIVPRVSPVGIEPTGLALYRSSSADSGMVRRAAAVVLVVVTVLLLLALLFWGVEEDDMRMEDGRRCGVTDGRKVRRKLTMAVLWDGWIQPDVVNGAVVTDGVKQS